MKAIDLSKYVVASFDNVGDLITNKHLQKILYYIKAWGLVYFEDGIIEDDFEAWVHGPVCPNVYQEYKKYGYEPIKLEYGSKSSSEFIYDFRRSNKHEANAKSKFEMIEAVLRKYGKLTSLQLELLSHQESPWVEARKDLGPTDNCSEIINNETMKSFYSKKNS